MPPRPALRAVTVALTFALAAATAVVTAAAADAATRPATPRSLALTNRGSVFSLGWTASGATGFQVEQATNATLTRGRRVYTLHGATPQLTPYGLTKGHRYWFRVRALARSSHSGWTSPVHGVPRTSEQHLTVMTYNVLENKFDGTEAGGTTVAPWSSRRTRAAALITASAPDVLAVQEGSSWVGQPRGRGGVRQVDDLDTLLTSYRLARTETPPTEPHYYRYGVYVLYRSAAFTAVGTGGVFDTGDGWSAYQLLRSRRTGALVLAVSSHLPRGDDGRPGDLMRQRETLSLIRQGGAYAAAHHATVLYAGDFNSDDAPRIHAFDGSGRAMRRLDHADAQFAAQATSHANYNSCNQYLRTPPAFGDSIDHVYLPPGVGVMSFSVVVRLSHGRFVGVIASDHNPVLARVSIRY